MQLKKVLLSVGMATVALLSACNMESSSEVDQYIKESIEEGEMYTISLANSGVFLTFDERGLTYYGSMVDNDIYDTPFEYLENYADYELEYDDDESLLTIEVPEGKYELKVYSPKVFRDEVNNIDLTSQKSLIPDET